MKNTMFKKCYGMSELGVFDFMVLNGRIAWNMSVTKK